MNSIKPASLEMVAYQRALAPKYFEVSDELLIPSFSHDLRCDISSLLNSKDNAQLIEAVARLGNYGDSAHHTNFEKSVSKLLSKRGVKLPRGKRTGRGLERLVEDLTPLLLYMGIPLASSERSHLVVILRRISEEFDVPGDPRDTLRSKIKADRIHRQKTQECLHEIFREAAFRAFCDPQKLNSDSKK